MYGRERRGQRAPCWQGVLLVAQVRSEKVPVDAVIRFVDRGSNPTAHRSKTKESLATCGRQVVPSVPGEGAGRVVVDPPVSLL